MEGRTSTDVLFPPIRPDCQIDAELTQLSQLGPKNSLFCPDRDCKFFALSKSFSKRACSEDLPPFHSRMYWGKIAACSYALRFERKMGSCIDTTA